MIPLLNISTGDGVDCGSTDVGVGADVVVGATAGVVIG